MKLVLNFILCFFQSPAAAETEIYEVHIVQQGWHTGIVFNVSDVPADIWPEIERYEDYEYVDVGWGDKAFFTTPGAGVYLMLTAALIPTDAVLLVMRYNAHPTDIYRAHSNVMAVEMDERQFRALCRFVAESYSRDDDGAAVPAGTKNFFLARRKYFLFRTCNTWVALALRKSGFKVRTFPLITESQLFNQLEKVDAARYVE